MPVCVHLRWLSPCVLMCIPVLHAHLLCAGMKLDAIYLSQIYNSGSERAMNTLVSVADEGVERRDLSILPGNYSRIYYQQ